VISTAHTPPCDELFDTVGQSIFGVGLLLEKCLESSDDPELRVELDASIGSLHAIIGRIRERGNLHCQHETHDC
jgi:hypothetical protein